MDPQYLKWIAGLAVFGLAAYYGISMLTGNSDNANNERANAERRRNENKYRNVKRLPVGKITSEEISKYTGENDSRIFVSICGRVLDVSYGHDYYGPDGPYHCFAGGDASYMLGKMSLDAQTKNRKNFVNTSDWDGDAHVTLSNWISSFRGKNYPIVGRLEGYEDVAVECWNESGYDDKKNNEENKMTFEQLKKKKEYLVSIGGYIFDVTSASTVYSSSYSDIQNAIGNDITFALLRNDFKPENYNQPLTKITNDEDKKQLKSILKAFRETYSIVGHIDDPSFNINLD